MFAAVSLGLMATLSGICSAADSGLLLHYDFSKLTGITVPDLSPHGNDGQIQGDAHLADDDHGKVLYFDGKTGFISVPGLSKWNLAGSMTISAVVKFLDNGTVMGQDDAHDMIVSKGNNFIFGVWPGGAGGRRDFYFNSFDGKDWNSANVFGAPQPGVWMQVDARITAVSVKDGRYKADYFINGENVYEAAHEGMFPAPNNDPVQIGFGFGSPCWLLHGYMASISLYGRAVTDREIVQSARMDPYVLEKPKQRLQAALDLSPKRGTGIITVNGSRIDGMDNAQLSYQVRRSGSTASVQRGLVRDFRDDAGTAQFALAGLVPGKYEVEVVCRTRDARTFTELSTFEKPDPQPWRDAHAGVSDKVLPPWTPLSLERGKGDLSIACWGREYRFDGSGFPADAVTRGERILQGPIGIVASVGGVPVRWQLGAASVTSSTPAKATFVGGAKAPGLRLDTESYMEFDGLVVTRCTLKADRPVTVGQCAMQIPLRAECAKYISYFRPTSLPYKGGFDKTCKEGGWNIPFPYYMWIGDDDRGFAWFSERDLSGRLKDRGKAVQIRSSADTTSVTVNLIDHPTTLDAPLSFTVGFQATPMKPLPPKWRSFFNERVDLVWTWPEITRHFGYPEATNPETYASLVAKSHANKKLFVPYTGLQMLSANSPEYQYFGQDWASGNSDNTSADVVAFKCPIYSVCPRAQDWADCVTWKIKQHVERYGIDGLYHDFTWPIFCKNTRHGCPEEGGYPILAMRDLYRRVYTILKDQPRETFMLGHTSWGLLCAPVCSFVDGTLPGEDVSVERGKGDYYHGMAEQVGFDGFKADSMSRQFGTMPVYWVLPETGEEYQKEKYDRRLLSILLLHDTLASAGHWRGSQNSRMWAVLRDFDIDDAQFIPYWANEQPVTVTAMDPRPTVFSLSAPVVVSVYNRPGKKALVVVGNTSGAAIHATLKIDGKALGLAETVRVRDAYGPETDLLKDGSVELDVPELEYRLLLVE
jgi:hypothetical protein